MWKCRVGKHLCLEFQSNLNHLRIAVFTPSEEACSVPVLVAQVASRFFIHPRSGQGSRDNSRSGPVTGQTGTCSVISATWATVAQFPPRRGLQSWCTLGGGQREPNAGVSATFKDKPREAKLWHFSSWLLREGAVGTAHLGVWVPPGCATRAVSPLVTGRPVWLRFLPALDWALA